MNEVDIADLAANHGRMDNPSVKDYIDARFETVDLRVAMERLRVEMHKNTADIIKWVVATSIAMTVANVSIIAFLLNRFDHH